MCSQKYIYTEKILRDALSCKIIRIFNVYEVQIENSVTRESCWVVQNSYDKCSKNLYNKILIFLGKYKKFYVESNQFCKICYFPLLQWWGEKINLGCSFFFGVEILEHLLYPDWWNFSVRTEHPLWIVFLYTLPCTVTFKPKSCITSIILCENTL